MFLFSLFFSNQNRNSISDTVLNHPHHPHSTFPFSNILQSPSTTTSSSAVIAGAMNSLPTSSSSTTTNSVLSNLTGSLLKNGSSSSSTAAASTTTTALTYPDSIAASALNASLQVNIV